MLRNQGVVEEGGYVEEDTLGVKEQLGEQREILCIQLQCSVS